MALLSCWGEVTTENELDVIAANRKIHPQIESLLSVLCGILNSANVEYWIDQGTLLGAYRHGKFIARDSDADIAIRNEDQFEALQALLSTELPNTYGCERKGSHCKGYRVWLKAGGTFEGTHEGRNIEWPLIACDVMFYRFNEQDRTYVQQYQGFGVDTCFFPEAVIFPLDAVEFEGSTYPCPARTKRYLEIQYGYIGDGAIWDPDTDRWIKGQTALVCLSPEPSTATLVANAPPLMSVRSQNSSAGPDPVVCKPRPIDIRNEIDDLSRSRNLRDRPNAHRSP